jgi:hypothetical protein
MKKLFLNFLMLPLFVLLAAVSCQDHYIPPTPPAIQTNDFQFIPSRRSERYQVPVAFNCEFTSLGVGAADITEYGVIYLTDYEGTPEADELSVGGMGTKVPFSQSVELGVNKEQAAEVDSFYGIYYRAYAISTLSGVVYGEMKTWEEERD